MVEPLHIAASSRQMFAAALGVALCACSGNDMSPGASTGGGNLGAGGQTVAGTENTAGGVVGFGGSSTTVNGTEAGGTGTESGGTLGSGGSVATGGSPFAGASSALGGTKPTGGSVSLGGAIATGGSLASGGVKATGGTKATGGSLSSGGAKATGGSLSSGGTKATGGSLSSGGTKATGGAGGMSGTSCPYTGHVTYTLSKNANPTSTEQNAYTLITAAMDKALTYYNCYTNLTKALNVSYNTSVSTADGSSNGSIRFGSDTSYMDYRTAMHEIAHTVGIGTSSKWTSCVDTTNSLYTCTNGKQQLAAINSQLTKPLYADLHADTQHFWPYGINYQSEVTSEADLLYHCQIVMAIVKDMA